MSSFTYTTKFTLAVGVLLTCIVWLWTTGVPTSVSSSTYAALAALLVALGAVTLITWRNARATDSMGQLLHATETAKSSRSSRIE